MKFFPAALACLLSACSSSAPEGPPPPEKRYRDAWLDFSTESTAMLRFAGKNRLHAEGSAGRARAALETMRGMLKPEPAEKLAPIAERFGAISRSVASADAVSGGQEIAVQSIRDAVRRDFSPDAVDVGAAPAAVPSPVPPELFARWEAAHARFATDAAANEKERVVQDYSEIQAALEGLATTEDDRLRAQRFLREYERVAGLVQSGAAMEQDLKGLHVLESDIRSAFGGRP